MEKLASEKLTADKVMAEKSEVLAMRVKNHGWYRQMEVVINKGEPPRNSACQPGKKVAEKLTSEKLIVEKLIAEKIAAENYIYFNYLSISLFIYLPNFILIN